MLFKLQNWVGDKKFRGIMHLSGKIFKVWNLMDDQFSGIKADDCT